VRERRDSDRSTGHRIGAAARAGSAADRSARRALTLLLEPVGALGLDDLLRDRPRALAAAAARAIRDELPGPSDPDGHAPAAWTRRRIVEALAAQLELEIVQALDRHGSNEAWLAAVRDPLAKAATPDRPPGEPGLPDATDENLAWLDPAAWRSGRTTAGRDADPGVEEKVPDAPTAEARSWIALAYATYFVRLQTEELARADRGDRSSERELCAAASASERDRRWSTVRALERRFGISWDELRENFEPDADGSDPRSAPRVV